MKKKMIDLVVWAYELLRRIAHWHGGGSEVGYPSVPSRLPLRAPALCKIRTEGGVCPTVDGKLLQQAQTGRVSGGQEKLEPIV